jgi:hypothetical protein
MIEVRCDLTAELRSKLLRRLVWKVPLILLLVSFAVWWQWRKDSERNPNSGASARAGAVFVGSWSGEVTYSWEKNSQRNFSFNQRMGSYLAARVF